MQFSWVLFVLNNRETLWWDCYEPDEGGGGGGGGERRGRERELELENFI